MVFVKLDCIHSSIRIAYCWISSVKARSTVTCPPAVDRSIFMEVGATMAPYIFEEALEAFFTWNGFRSFLSFIFRYFKTIRSILNLNNIGNKEIDEARRTTFRFAAFPDSCDTSDVESALKDVARKVANYRSWEARRGEYFSDLDTGNDLERSSTKF